MTISKSKLNYFWLILLFFVLLSNVILYKTEFGISTLQENPNSVVIGSLIDFIILAPATFLLYKKTFSWKLLIGLSATGCVAARFIIPMEYLQPFHMITWSGIALEGALVVFEIALVFTFFRYLPKIFKDVKKSSFPLLFAFPEAVDRYVKKIPIIYVICTELLTYYYALFSWKKKPYEGFTIHKNTSAVALNVMIIHAVVLETVGVHWLLHILHIPTIISIILLIINIYGVIFILGDMQALRLNPIYMNDDSLFLSQGLMKRAKIPFDYIEEIITDKEQLEQKIKKDTLPFIVIDFEKVHPNVILKLNKPIQASLIMGIEREYIKVALRVDDPNSFIKKIEEKLNN